MAISENALVVWSDDSMGVPLVSSAVRRTWTTATSGTGASTRTTSKRAASPPRRCCLRGWRVTRRTTGQFHQNGLPHITSAAK
jgi:hypothetical protein